MGRYGFLGAITAILLGIDSSAAAESIIPGFNDVEGYAGPGWSILFDADGSVEMASLAPVMFRIAGPLSVGPLVAYEESAAEGPSFFRGGLKAEFVLAPLSLGPYSTSLWLSLMGGAIDLNGDAEPAFQASAGLDADLLLVPSLRLSVGPMLSLSSRLGDMDFLSGFTCSLKEGTAEDPRALFHMKRGYHVGGYWQGLWCFLEGAAAFIDGGGTRLELPSGLAFGATGGVLRQRIARAGSALAISQMGFSAEWNWRPRAWLTIAPRLVSGLALCGWVDASGSIDGGPFFMARPELSAHVGILPFLEIGGSIGYLFTIGELNTAIPLPALSSVAFSIQARVGERW